MTGRKTHSDETIAQARALLAGGMGLMAIAEQLGVPYSSLRYRLRAERQAMQTPPRPALRLRRRDRATRPLLIARLWSTAERQVAEIETRLGEAGGDPTTLERDAKTLSVLARTVRDLVALDTAEKKETRADADEVPKDIDGFRRALAEKLVELGKLERDDGGAFAAGPAPA